MAKSDPLDSIPTGLKLFIKNLHSLTPEKLDDKNFPSWFSTVSANLKAHRLMQYVDGSNTAPPPTLTVTNKEGVTSQVPNPEYETWSVIDAQLCACLLAIVNPTVQTYLHSQTTAAGIWAHIQLRYNSLSRTHIFQLKDQLHNVQKGNDSMQVYLDSIVKIVADLDRAQSEIPEQDVILCILRGLPSDYSSIKQNIRTNIAHITLTEVVSWLLQEELNLQMEQNLHLRDSSSTNPHTALYTQANYRGRGRGPHRGRGGRNSSGGRPSYVSCGQFSSRGSGRGPFGGRGGQSSSRDVVICQICGKYNHAAWDCWHRFNSDYAGPTISTSPQEHYAAQSTPANGNWFLDTGANTHVTPDLSRLYSFTPYSGTNTVTTAGGESLPIAHVGSDPGQQNPSGEV